MWPGNSNYGYGHFERKKACSKIPAKIHEILNAQSKFKHTSKITSLVFK
jgi:hypothetical protein